MQRHEAIRRLAMRGAALLALIATLAGCQRDEVRVYDTPKEDRPAPAAISAAEAPITWTLPDGWREIPGSGMRHATLLVGDASEPVEVRVTPLGMMARDALANVNRWREQIGQEPVTESELGRYVRSIEVDGHAVDLVNLVGEGADGNPAPEILAAIVEGGERVWFFLVMDDAPRVAPHTEAFEAFIRTVRFPGPGTSSPAPRASSPAAAAVPPAGGADDATWTAPAGWQVQTSTSAMRLAGYDLTRDGAAAEITITRFPGDVGGLLANVNRWRGQIGLAPVADLDQQPMRSMPIGGESGALVDLVGPAAGNDEPPRAMVAMVAHGGMTWFFKMNGPASLIGAEEETFLTFVRSVRFGGAPGIAGDDGE